MLVSAHLCNWASLPELSGLFWQRQFFTSQIQFGFLAVFAGNVLGKMGLTIMV